MKICPACEARFDSPSWHCPACGFEPQQVDGFAAFAPALAAGGGGFRPEYFARLAALEARNFWFVARNRVILREVARHFPNLRSYLEIGCGTGYVLSAMQARFPGMEAAGSEIFSAGLAHAKQRLPQAQFFQMDARAIPYDAHWDLVGACDVIEHIEEDEAVLRRIHLALKPQGGLLLTVPQHQWMWSVQDDLACHVRRYSSAQLVDRVQRAGFEVLACRSFVSLLLPAMWLSRKTGSADPARHDPMRELEIPGWLNGALGAVMRLEYALTGLGLDLPFGGSLVLVARKA